MTYDARRFSRSFTATHKVWQACGLLLVSVVFGGGGAGAGLFNLAVQLIGIAILSLNKNACLGFFQRAPVWAAVLAGVTLLLPLLQLVPLPPQLWGSLPGRELAVDSMRLLGLDHQWAPLSVNPQRTLIAFFSLLPPFAMVILMWEADEEAWHKLALFLVVCGVLVVILGAQQLALGNMHLMFFEQTRATPDLQGTFANHNSTGLFLDLVLCVLIALMTRRSFGWLPLVSSIAVAVLLVVGVFLSRSRSAMFLLVVPGVQFLFSIFQMRARFSISRGATVLAIVAAVLAAGVGFLILSGSDRVRDSLSRFDDLQDARPAIWRDTYGAIGRYWPVGSGIGTFDEVFQIDESLENIGPGRAGRAHNEYLEVALESGVVGVLLLGGWLVALLISFARLAATSRAAIAAGAAFVSIAMQSILDYPLRSQTLLCVAGLMLALLIRRPGREEKRKRSRGNS